ncbi:MAG: glycosyltransferase family 39 protein [Anaerolineae bacterium]|nr:glycosyltransferase family 39 protein [Anaerolineae bacterium]
MNDVIRAVVPILLRASRVFLAVFLALAGIVFVLNAGLSIAFRYPLDYGEAPLVDQARRLLAGETIYGPDLNAPPYTISNYPPLFPLALVPGLALFGPTFVFGRLLSVVCGLATAAALWRFTWTHTQQRAAAWLAAMTFLAWPYVLEWSARLRVDLLALALSTWALYVVSRWPRERWAVVLTGVLLVAAVFARQSYGLAAPFAAFVWLWAKAGWRRAFLLAGVAVAIGVSLLLLSHHAREVLRVAPLMLAGGAAMLLVGPRAISAWPLLAPYLIGALASAMTIGKIGSNINYLLELCAALSLAGGALVGWLTADKGISRARQLWRPGIGVIALLLIALQTGFLVQVSLDGPVQALRARREARPALTNLEALVAAAEGPVLADEYMGMLVLQGRSLALQPFEMTQLSLAGLWDQQPLLDRIRERRFPLILIHHFRDWLVYKERWSPEMLDAVLASYEATHAYAETVVFEPRTGDLLSVDAPCPGFPWHAPTRGDFGVWWVTRELAFMGEGYEQTVPVVAVADGLLYRDREWDDAVAIQHDDPLNAGQKVWTFYGNMAISSQRRSLVDPAFPPGTESVAVKAGQFLGYQGRTWTTEIGWVHLRFAVAPALGDGSFPAALLDLPGSDVVPVPVDLRLLDPSLYLGTQSSNVMGQPVWLPSRCTP